MLLVCIVATCISHAHIARICSGNTSPFPHVATMFRPPQIHTRASVCSDSPKTACATAPLFHSIRRRLPLDITFYSPMLSPSTRGCALVRARPRSTPHAPSPSFLQHCQAHLLVRITAPSLWIVFTCLLSPPPSCQEARACCRPLCAFRSSSVLPTTQKVFDGMARWIFVHHCCHFGVYVCCHYRCTREV